MSWPKISQAVSGKARPESISRDYDSRVSSMTLFQSTAIFVKKSRKLGVRGLVGGGLS